MAKSNHRVEAEYQPTEYLQFSNSRFVSFLRGFLGLLLWPVALPLALLSKTSDIVFRAISELLAIVPYFPGVLLRYEFYRFALRKVGRNVLIEFGTIFIYPDVEIGDNVLIGRYNIIHHCDFGDYVLTGERCTFLSGSRQHNTDDRNHPIALQGGYKKRITISDDVWIGVHVVVADDIGSGSVITMGSVVNKPVPEYTIGVGNPLRMLPRQ